MSEEDEFSGSSSGNDLSLIGPWTVSEDDNRTRLESCGLAVEGDVNATSITAAWSIPVNRSSNTRYRLEVAEEGNFSTGYLAFANLVETMYQVSSLKPNTEYCLRLQAYNVPDDDTLTSSEPFHAPSEPEIAWATTRRNPLLCPGNLELTIEHGKFSAKWDPPANASGKLEYWAGLQLDDNGTTPFEFRFVKEPFIKDWIVVPEQDYWLRIQALPDPDSTNQGDSDSLPLVKQFHVPGNQLQTPGNFKVTTSKNMINLSWDPINNNSQVFEYLLMVYLDEERRESFGEYHLDTPKESISGVNQNPRYWFDLQAVPASGNHSDVASEAVSYFMELPSKTYAIPKISSLDLEPINDPEEPRTIIKLAWDGSVNGDGLHKYRVEIADDMDFQTGFQDYEEDADSSGGEYGPLDPGRTYYLRMRAVGPPDDVTRIHSGWSEVKTIVTPGAPSPVDPNE